MIFVQRTPDPGLGNSPRAAHLAERLAAYYAQPPDARRQRRPPTEEAIRLVANFRGPLCEMFNNKCAYCESPVNVAAPPSIDFFRPRTSTDLTGHVSIDHYSWLVLDWNNLYLACAECTRAKRDYFPVVESRSRVSAPLEEIRRTEHPLLIDPCWDQPEEHLFFTSEGRVGHRSREGSTTIDVLQLNREALVEQRRRAWYDANSMAAAGGRQAVLRTIHAGHPWAAVGRAFLRSFDQRSSATPSGLEPEPVRPPSHLGPAPVLSPEDETRAQDFRQGARPLRRIEIQNFKLLRDFVIELPEATGDHTPWLVLLGENATGKSTVLQAVALALAGSREASLCTRPGKVLTLNERSGHVRLHFWDHDEPVELTFRRGNQRFGGHPKPSALAIGYGALRLPRRTASRVIPRTQYVHVDGLVRDISWVPNPTAWLRSLTDEQFDAVARVLKLILPDQDDARVERTGNTVTFRVGDTRTGMNALSAGYQTVLRVTIDVLRILFTHFEAAETAQGVVLVDELESHLHPRWKMRIVGALRRALPRVQFIVSTHDPLILRGVKNRELAVMRRDLAHGAMARTDLPDVEALQVDQLLTSEHFGLSSTFDPALESAFNEYYYLLARAHITPMEQARIDDLKEHLDGKGQLGATRRERLMYQVIDTFLAEADADGRSHEPLDEATLAELQRIWNNDLSAQERLR